MKPGPDLAGARVAVCGLGASGSACLIALKQAGAKVVEVDDDVPGAILGARLDLAGIDLVVASPGWKPSSPPLPDAARLGIQVWSEVELAWRLRARPSAPWLAITGTNGKTTATGMLASILLKAGLNAKAAGNIGTPLVSAVLDPDVEAFACELSSFQLHFTHTMAPRAAALINVAPDHLDWHGSFDAYLADKARVFNRAGAGVVGPDAELGALARRGAMAPRSSIVRVTPRAPQAGEIGVLDGALVDRATDKRTSLLADLVDLAHLQPGRRAPADHIVIDALIAAALARSWGIGGPDIAAGLRAFTLADHRGQVVARVDGIDFVDDSKATNAHAAALSLLGRPRGKTVWICGGLAKGARFESLVKRVAPVLAGAVVIGEDRLPFADALGRHASDVPLIEVAPGETGTVMSLAVSAARSLAPQGGTVVLAPAAASMDQFASYAERGEAFADAARALEAER